MELDFFTIKSLLQAYQSQVISVDEYLKNKLNTIRDDQSNAWISVLSDEQLEHYLERLKQSNIEELPLYGVPFAVKDNIDLLGLPTTAGCREFSYQPQKSANVVSLLIAAGAIPLGKTNLDQFATGLVGTRSPWGAVKNSFNPDYISGGSSSGSGVSVASNQVLFSLGTDTAGSGRVPAAFNNIYGLKPTKGLLSCSGVVPACRSLDCVTLFSKSAQDLDVLFDVVAQPDEQDAYSRKNVTSLDRQKKEFNGLKVGLPKASLLNFFGNEEYETAFKEAVKQLEKQGATLVEFDLEPFLDAATLLYQGPWVAERYAAIENFFEQDSSRCLPVIEEIVSGATHFSAVDTFKSIYQLQDYKARCDRLLEQVDVVVTPTAGTIHTIEAVNDDPITLNSQLGYYTNFMNLLDYSAIAIPSEITPSGLPFGITLFTRSFSDKALLSLAQEWQEEVRLPLGCTPNYIAAEKDFEQMSIVVCGAHMQGLPLNKQLLSLGGSLQKKTQTSSSYQFFALAGGPPYRPGLVRTSQNGSSIEVEVWNIPTKNVGELLAMIPEPLGLGSIELVSGHWVKGFICEPIGLEGAEDITHLGSWRNYLSE